MRNTEIGVFWLVLDPVDGLDSVRDICKVHKGAVPVRVIQIEDFRISKERQCGRLGVDGVNRIHTSL